MKKLIKIIGFTLFMVGPWRPGFAASISKTISSTTFSAGFAASDVLILNPKESMTWTLTGAATGTILLEKSIDGSNFNTVTSSVNNTNGILRGVEYSNEQTSFYRWRASTMTGAGSFSVTLDDNDDLVTYLNNNKKITVFELWDETVRLLNSKGISLSNIIPSTATNSGGNGLSELAYLTGTAAVAQGSVVLATTPVAGQGVSVVLAPVGLNQSRVYGVVKSSANINNPIDVYISGVTQALTTGTVIPGDMLGTSALTAGYLSALTSSSQTVVAIALTNGISAGGLTKVKLK